jgi:hypothetical protein
MTEQLPAIIDQTESITRIHAALAVPALIATPGERASRRFLEFFAANVRNPHTRRAYGRAVAEFLAWCDDNRDRSRPCSRHRVACRCKVPTSEDRQIYTDSDRHRQVAA